MQKELKKLFCFHLDFFLQHSDEDLNSMSCAQSSEFFPPGKFELPQLDKTYIFMYIKVKLSCCSSPKGEI